MNIKDVQAFVAVAETGSVSRAAARLHLTQPALTRRIQNLETRLGASLLDRTSKPPRLSPSGRRALDLARRALRSLAELEASCLPEGEMSGPLRLGVAHGIAEFALAEPLDALRRAFPRLELLVRTAWTPALSDELRSGSLDAVVGFFPSTRERTLGPTQTLGQEDVVVVASDDYPGPETASIADLKDASWVLNPAGCTYRTALERAFDRHDGALKIAIEVVGRELQLSLVRRKVGLGLCPLRALRGRADHGGMRVVQVPDLAIRVDIALVSSPGAADLSQPLAILAEGVTNALDKVSENDLVA